MKSNVEIVLRLKCIRCKGVTPHQKTQCPACSGKGYVETGMSIKEFLQHIGVKCVCEDGTQYLDMDALGWKETVE